MGSGIPPLPTSLVLKGARQMKYPSDHDGKSKTASAVDQEHYPEQNEVENQGFEAETGPTHDQIAARAREIWKARGEREGSAEQDWLQAEAELQAATDSLNTIQSTARRA